MFDFLVRGCRILDGTGGKGYSADLGIRNGRIEAIGNLAAYAADRVLEAGGCTLAPGFIDIHSHSDLDAAAYPLEMNKLSQGVTTECCGNCGFSLFPITDAGRPAIREMMKAYQRNVDPPWSCGEEYYAFLEALGIGFNYYPLAGHGILRINAMGFSSAPAGVSELKRMEDLLAREMEAGARGYSSGLGYAPGCFADKDELVALAKVSARYGGIYTSHIRNQGNRLLESVEEAIEIGREAEIPVIISHLKAYGVGNWGKAEAALEAIDKARSEGIRVMADFYPYDSASSTLAYELPEWAKEGGPERILERLASPADRDRIRKDITEANEISWDRVIVCGVRTEANRGVVGQSVREIADSRGRDPFDAAFDLLLEESCGVETVCALMSEKDLESIARAPFTSLGSDAYALDTEKPFTGHPRNYGAFPRFFRAFVREKKLLTWEEAVRKTSGMAAEFLGLSDRGTIGTGRWADLVLFDPESLADRATYLEPGRASEGIKAVFVNGVLQYGNGTIPTEKPGRLLKR